MNRRKFIKSASGIFVPAIVGLKSKAQVLTLADPALNGSIASAGTCTQWLAQTTDNDYWNPAGGGTCAQRIQNSESRVVCKAILKTYHSFGTSMDLRCAISSDSTGSSIVGSWSNTSTIATSTATWLEFTWSSNPTTPASDFYLVFDQITTEVGWRIRVNYGVPSHTYCFYVDGSQKDTSDGCYEIHTIQ